MPCHTIKRKGHAAPDGAVLSAGRDKMAGLNECGPCRMGRAEFLRALRNRYRAYVKASQRPPRTSTIGVIN